VVICYRALNERSGRRFGQVSRGAVRAATSSGVDNGWHYPMGLGTPAATVAMIARRYMHDYGATSEDFGRVTVADRRHAATNPKAWFYRRPVTPRRAPGVAVDRRAAAAARLLPGERRRGRPGRDERRSGPRPPAAAGGDPRRRTGQRPGPVRDDQLPTATSWGYPRWAVVARQLWRQAGIGPQDVRLAVALRPLHAVRPAPAGGARVLPARGGPALHHRRGDRAGRAAPGEPARRPARRGVHPRDERHREGVRQVRGTSVQPGRRRRPGARHRRHRRPHQRP